MSRTTETSTRDRGASLILAIGFVLFTYGKKMHRLPQLIGGIALMVYPYFTPTVTTLVSVGTLICALVWFAVQLDY